MEYEIYHHGVKGQKWGIRRYQTKDGSLTRLGKKRRQSGEDVDKEETKAQKKAVRAQSKAQKQQAKDEAKKRSAEEAAKKQQEQEEAKKKQAEADREKLRNRILKSTNAQEIYEGRNLLTTQEINERLTRIDTERRLANEAEKSKVTFGKKVEGIVDKASKAANTIESAYQITQKPFFKALMKQMKGDTTPTTSKFDMDGLLKKIDTMSSKELKDALDRTRDINTLERTIDLIKNRRNGTP